MADHVGTDQTDRLLREAIPATASTVVMEGVTRRSN